MAERVRLRLWRQALMLGLSWGMGLGLAEGIFAFLYVPTRETLIPKLGAWVYVLVLYGALVAVGFLLLALVLMGVLRLARRQLTAEMLPLWLPATAVAGLALLRYVLPRIADLLSGSMVAVSALVSMASGLVVSAVAVLAVVLLVKASRDRLARVDWLNRWWKPSVLVVYGLLTVALLIMGLNRNLLWRLRPGPAGRVARAAAEKPNIVLLTIDALRVDHLGVYGYEKDISPHIDALAARGVRFEQAIVQAPWTYPSFASMMTSHYPTELDQAGYELTSCWVDEQWVTLAEALHDAGYATQAIVTNPWLDKKFGFDQGFDGYVSVDGTLGWRIMLLRESLWGKLPLPIGEWLQATKRWALGPEGRWWDTDAATVNYHVVRWLYRNRREPFFLWVHYIDPHSPYDPEPRWMPKELPTSPARVRWLRRHQLEIGNTRMHPEDIETLRALYDAEIQGADEGVGEIIATLEELGLSEHTVIVVTADHGEEFGEHGGYEHGRTLYDEVLRVPLIMAGSPLGETRQVVKEQVRTVDLMPTLLELAGAEPPPGMRGESLLAFMRSTGEELPSRPAFSEALLMAPDKYAIRYKGFKVIACPFEGGREVYDLNADPGEHNNLAAHSSSTIETLWSALNAWREEMTAVAAEMRSTRGVPRAIDETLRRQLQAGGY